MELSNYKASEIPEIMAKAFTSRSGRPGPVLVDITKMHNLMSLSSAIKCTGIRVMWLFKIEQKVKLQELINKAKTIYCFWSRIILGQAEEN
jgi:thiamine pyrophosphate-dependent acetolactate synthase large subunit-like protein